MVRKEMPGATSRMAFVDHGETYGRHILKNILKNINVSHCVDLGCGNGDDLQIVKSFSQNSICSGIDYGLWNYKILSERHIDVISLDIESAQLPFSNESVDFVIANQIFEHTKNIFWINHEIFRTLTVGGYLYLGVPNVLSFHNRILGLFGLHPTCAQTISAHMRVFSKYDTIKFYKNIAGDILSIDQFYGSQFYPFPRIIARPLSVIFPSLAYSIFFLIRKTKVYNGEFIEWLNKCTLETNFYRGLDIEPHNESSTHPQN